MTNNRHDEPPEIMPANPPPILPLPTTVADLGARFYEIFCDVSPLGTRDIAYFEALLEDFAHELDIHDELKRFHAWSLDKGIGAVKYPRSRFRDWLRRSRTFQRHYRPNARPTST